MQLGHDHRTGEGSLRLDPPPSITNSSPDIPPSSARSEDNSSSPRPPNPVSPTSATSGHETAPVTDSPTECPSTVPLVLHPGTSSSSQPSEAAVDSRDIEMASVTPSGHRRRRSSLINPANSASSRSQRPRAQSVRGPVVDDDGKIPEESSEDDPLRLDEVADGGLSDEDLHDDEETGLTGKDRRRKRRKRNRSQLLDHRIVGDHISQEEKKEADRNVVKHLFINGVLIGLWYFFSLCISLYNKWMFSPDKLNFPFPMFTTSVHFLVQFSLASLVLFLFPSLRPRHKSDLGQSRHEAQPDKPVMTKLFYLTRIGPCGVATGLDIGLGNTSLQFITLTFYTMCKSSSLAFVLLFAFLFRLEAPTWKLVAIIATMTLGVIMMVAGEVEFHLGGFVLVIAAAFFSGFRWGLTQILLLRNPATSNPFSSIFFLAPVMFVALVAIAVPVEGARALLEGLRGVANQHGVFAAPLLLLFPGVIAFLMTASEFALLKRTSVVTLSIAGIFKEAVTILAAALVFGDTMTPVNVIGLVVTLAAIASYNWIKISKMRKEAQTDVHRGHLDAEEAAAAAAAAAAEARAARRPRTLSPPAGRSGGGSGSGSRSASGGGSSGSDEEQEEERMGLLRRSLDAPAAPPPDQVLFTADGGNLVIATGPDPSSNPGHGEVPRDGRPD